MRQTLQQGGGRRIGASNPDAAANALESLSFAWDVLAKLALIPAASRPQAFARILPILRQKFPNEDLSSFDLSDAGLKERLAAYDQLMAELRPLVRESRRGDPAAFQRPPKKGGRRAFSAASSPYRSAKGAVLLRS